MSVDGFSWENCKATGCCRKGRDKKADLDVLTVFCGFTVSHFL